MTKTTFFAILFLFGLSTAVVQAKEATEITISGQIKNPNADSILINYSNQMHIATFYLDDNNAFSGTVNLPRGYYWLTSGNETTTIFLKPKSDLKIIVDAKQFDETLTYEGALAPENNYLGKKFLLNESFGQYKYYGFYAKQTETDFLRTTDSLHQIELQFLKVNHQLSDEFKSLETDRLLAKKLDRFSSFQSMRQFVTQDTTFFVSDQFPDYYKNIDINRGDLSQSRDYISFVRGYFSKKASEVAAKDESQDYALVYLKLIAAEIDDKAVKNELLYGYGSSFLSYAEDLEAAYGLIKKSLTNDVMLTEVTKVYEKLRKLAKGEESAPFTLSDINGKTVSLSDLKGKLVYIDLWATWCMPCLMEIPKLKALEHDLKEEDIVFVSICVMDTEESWRAKVAEEKLNGIQLFEPNRNSDFLSFYNVSGIPHFIILDKEGKIIDAKADRPSNPDLKLQLLKHLEE